MEGEGNNGGPRRLLVAPMVIWEGRGRFMFLRARDASQVGAGVSESGSTVRRRGAGGSGGEEEERRGRARDEPRQPRRRLGF